MLTARSQPTKASGDTHRSSFLHTFGCRYKASARAGSRKGVQRETKAPTCCLEPRARAGVRQQKCFHAPLPSPPSDRHLPLAWEEHRVQGSKGHPAPWVLSCQDQTHCPRGHWRSNLFTFLSERMPKGMQRNKTKPEKKEISSRARPTHSSWKTLVLH